jgi:hypothetical protein
MRAKESRKRNRELVSVLKEASKNFILIFLLNKAGLKFKTKSTFLLACVPDGDSPAPESPRQALNPPALPLKRWEAAKLV